MIKKAVGGLIPLISVRSTDLLHIDFVLRGMFPDHDVLSLGSKHVQIDERTPLYYSPDTPKENTLNDLYNDAEQNEYSVIFVNPEPDPRLMECGELVPDEKTIHQMLAGEIPKKILKESVAYLKGLTVQHIKQTLSLCSIYYDQISVESIRKTKERLFIHQTGITKVDPETPFYFEQKGTGTGEQNLSKWVDENKPYMFADVDHRLVPKGVLMYGDAGTGKTEFAKYIARGWGLSLFLLDVNSMLSKWQGEAEHHLNQALSTLDKESPCIVLFDEVEKLFIDNSENDTSQRLLSKLLWWLQYKTSKVYVVMTCNNLEALPTELYRSGRIDQLIKLRGLHKDQLEGFVIQLLQSFGITTQEGSVGFNNCMKTMGFRMAQSKATNKEFFPQALVSQWVIEFLQSTKHGL